MGKQWTYTDSIDGKPYPREELKKVVLSTLVDGVTTKWALYVTETNEGKLESMLGEITKNETANDPEEFPEQQAAPADTPKGSSGSKGSSKGSKGTTGADGLTKDQRQALRLWAKTVDIEVAARGRISQEIVRKFRQAQGKTS